MEKPQRIVITKRISLQGLSEEWDDTCYALVKPATYEDNILIETTDFSKDSKTKQVEFQRKFVQDRLVKGQIKVFDGEQYTAAKLLPEDVGASVELLDALFAGIIGLDTDPKALREAAIATTTSQESDMKPTSMESSTDSE